MQSSIISAGRESTIPRMRYAMPPERLSRPSFSGERQVVGVRGVADRPTESSVSWQPSTELSARERHPVPAGYHALPLPLPDDRRALCLGARARSQDVARTGPRGRRLE